MYDAHVQRYNACCKDALRLYMTHAVKPKNDNLWIYILMKIVKF